MLPRGQAIALLLAIAMTMCLNAHSHAQYLAQYGSPQAYQPGQTIPVLPGGCYSAPSPSGSSCYSVTAINPPAYQSCYSQRAIVEDPPKPDEYNPGPKAQVLCHDTVVVTHKVTLNRYYPVYIHLKENQIEGVQIQEHWRPVCVLCTKEKPCPDHQGGKSPAHLPPPADPQAQVSPPTPTPSSSTTHGNDHPVQQAAAESPPPPSEKPVPIATPAAPPQPGPAKQWVWLTHEGVWGYGYQRADGYWEIDPGSRRPADGSPYQVASTPGS